MKRTWIYFQNPFLNAAKGNFKKAVKISTFHDSALKALALSNPAFVGMYNTYHTLHLALVAAYDTWVNSGGTHHGATLTIQQLITLLSPTKVDAWEYDVRAVFAKGSPGYGAIFPRQRKPFNKGSVQSKISAVGALSLALQPTAALAGVKSDVDAFLALLNTASSVQGADEADTEIDTVALTNSLEQAMAQMFSNYGSVVKDFPDSISEFDYLWDLETIRNHEQLIFTGTLEGNESHTVMKHTFAAADQLTLKAEETALKYYLAANTTDGPAGYTVIDVPANSSVVIVASAFGNLANRFLRVLNTDVLEGHFEVDLQ
jgi:hypothetical protein